MAKKFPTLKDGDEAQPFHFNIAYRELERLAAMTGGGTVTVRADGPAPPEIVGYTPDRTLIPVLLPSGITAGSYTSPSSTTGTLLQLNFTTAGFASSGKTETCYNPYGTAIVGTNKLAWFYRAADRRLYLFVSDC